MHLCKSAINFVIQLLSSYGYRYAPSTGWSCPMVIYSKLANFTAPPFPFKYRSAQLPSSIIVELSSVIPFIGALSVFMLVKSSSTSEVSEERWSLGGNRCSNGSLIIHVSSNVFSDFLTFLLIDWLIFRRGIDDLRYFWLAYMLRHHPYYFTRRLALFYIACH